MNTFRFFSFLALFISHATLAQVKQTSGGSADGSSHFSKNEKMDKKIAENFNDAIRYCYVKKSGTPPQFENIVDAHVFLSVNVKLTKMNKKNDNVDCSIDEIHTCLQLKANKYQVRTFIKNEFSIPYLMETYQIDQMQSQKILDFYKDLFPVEDETSNSRIIIDAGTDTIKGN